jgi:hypothetical protein
MSRPAEGVLAFYNKRGTCEQWIKEGKGANQVDATVVPNVRRQRGAAPASCACLQPRQFLAHAGDTGADRGLVTDKLEGQADQDWRESRVPRPLCRLPDGRGRHRTANVPGDFAAHRGTAAAATTSASMRRSMSCVQEQPTEGVRPNARENGQIRPSIKRSGYRGAGSGQAPRVCLARRPGKREHRCRFRIHLENLS